MPETAVAEPIVEDAQQTPSEPASDAPETETPADAQEATLDATFDWEAPETAETIIELAGDTLFETDRGKTEVEKRAQALADARIAEMQATPDYNTTYQQHMQQLQGARQARVTYAGQLQPLLAKMAAGEEVNAAEVGQLTAQAMRAALDEGQFAGALVNQEVRVTTEGVMTELFGGRGDLPVKAGAKTVTLGDAFDNALRAYESDSANRDPRAGSALIKRMLHLSAAAAYEEGHRAGLATKGTKEQAKQSEAAQALANELAAKQAAKRNGQTAPHLGGEPKEKRSESELLADPETPIAIVREIRQRQRA